MEKESINAAAAITVSPPDQDRQARFVG